MPKEVEFTIDGLDDLHRAAPLLPAQVEANTRGVAQRTAQRVLARARANLAAKTHGTGATAAAIHIVEDAADKTFSVVSPGAPHQRISLHRMPSGRMHTQRVSQNNLPIWLEYGTVKMAAREYMRPAANAEQAQYAREMEAAALGPVRKIFEG